MEVTDDSSVNEAVQSIVEKAGPMQYLSNNTGYTVTGALEETSIEEARQLFETNFFGVLRVTNAILPTMRQAAQGREKAHHGTDVHDSTAEEEALKKGMEEKPRVCRKGK